MLHFAEICPFPSNDKFDFLGVLKGARYTVCVEQNSTGQFARLVRMETGYEFRDRLNRFDGRPFTLDSFIGEIDGRIKRL
jgi:2-oxoglutarate ferredoxin oxidoreductase subunit alpha